MQPFMGYIMDRIRSMRKEVQKCCKLYIEKEWKSLHIKMRMEKNSCV